MTGQWVHAPETLLQAYAMGVFPMAESATAEEIRLYQPEERALLPLDPPHIPRRLRRTVRQRQYALRWNSAFAAVIDGCAAPAAGRPTTWINAEIRRLYIALHKMGFAHSVEVFDQDQLVGGLYGVALGGAFFGESMFSLRPDASKIALVHLIARLLDGGFQLLDAQFDNDHLRQFGLFTLDNDRFQDRLQAALQKPAFLRLDQSEDAVLAVLEQAITVTS